MKKLIVLGVSFFLIIGAIVLPQIDSKEYPEYIYNYLEQGQSKKLVVNLNDYIVLSKGVKGFYVYDKNTKEIVPLGDTVFDYNKDYATLMFGVDNTVYYEAKDKQTNTRTVYEFNVDTYKVKKMYSQTGLTDIDGFLGMNELFGVYASYNMNFSKSGNFVVNKNGFTFLPDIYKLLYEKDTDNAYNIPNGSIKLSAIKDCIYFINDFNELLCYCYDTNVFSRVTDEKVQDFFITDKYIYVSLLTKPGELYRLNIYNSALSYIGKIEIKEMRYNGNKTVVYVSDLKNIYVIEDEKLIRKSEYIDGWEIEENILYIYKPNSVTIAEKKLKK